MGYSNLWPGIIARKQRDEAELRASDLQRQLDDCKKVVEKFRARDSRESLARNLVIDHDVLGWGDDHTNELLEKYKSIMQVGKHDDLSQRAFDEKVAGYCKSNDCDLMTGDAKSYTHFFEVGIKSVNVSKYSWWPEGDRPIYLVKIEE